MLNVTRIAWYDTGRREGQRSAWQKIKTQRSTVQAGRTIERHICSRHSQAGAVALAAAAASSPPLLPPRRPSCCTARGTLWPALQRSCLREGAEHWARCAAVNVPRFPPFPTPPKLRACSAPGKLHCASFPRREPAGNPGGAHRRAKKTARPHHTAGRPGTAWRAHHRKPASAARQASMARACGDRGPARRDAQNGCIRTCTGARGWRGHGFVQAAMDTVWQADSEQQCHQDGPLAPPPSPPPR